MLRKLFEAGVDTFRLNFSHGAKQDHAKVHAAIRALEIEMGRPIGILLDLTALQDVEWKARWEEFRFLKKFGGPIARVAVIGARTWEALMGDLAGATVLMQADIRYFQPSEIIHAWHWVHTAKFADEVPVRQLVPPGHLMSGYNPEYADI